MDQPAAYLFDEAIEENLKGALTAYLCANPTKAMVNGMLRRWMAKAAAADIALSISESPRKMAMADFVGARHRHHFTRADDENDAALIALVNTLGGRAIQYEATVRIRMLKDRGETS